MEIKKMLDGTKETIELKGRLDTTTAPQLQEEVAAVSGQITSLVIDLKELDYISSAGLRVLLQAQKKMNKQGEMLVQHVNETIMEIFEVTGFNNILTIE